MAARRIGLAEAALRARMSRERVLRLLTAGHIEGEMVGGYYMVCPLSLEAHLAQRGPLGTPSPLAFHPSAVHTLQAGAA